MPQRWHLQAGRNPRPGALPDGLIHAGSAAAERSSWMAGAPSPGTSAGQARGTASSQRLLLRLAVVAELVLFRRLQGVFELVLALRRGPLAAPGAWLIG